MNPEDYKQWIAELKNRVRSAQIKAAVSVNSELINLYWSIGQDIVERKVEDALGGNFYKRISQDLQSEFPNVKGFSERNIYYMRAMYVLFPLWHTNCHKLWQWTKCHKLWHPIFARQYAASRGGISDT